MTDYTVIPAAPGTVLINCYLEIEPDAEPTFQRFAVVGWRVFNEPDSVVSAIVVGGFEESVPEYCGGVSTSHGTSCASVVMMPDRLVAYQSDLIPEDKFYKLMWEALTINRRHEIERRNRLKGEI